MSRLDELPDDVLVLIVCLTVCYPHGPRLACRTLKRLYDSCVTGISVHNTSASVYCGGKQLAAAASAFANLSRVTVRDKVLGHHLVYMLVALLEVPALRELTLQGYAAGYTLCDASVILMRQLMGRGVALRITVNARTKDWSQRLRSLGGGIAGIAGLTIVNDNTGLYDDEYRYYSQDPVLASVTSLVDLSTGGRCVDVDISAMTRLTSLVTNHLLPGCALPASLRHLEVKHPDDKSYPVFDRIADLLPTSLTTLRLQHMHVRADLTRLRSLQRLSVRSLWGNSKLPASMRELTVLSANLGDRFAAPDAMRAKASVNVLLGGTCDERIFVASMVNSAWAGIAARGGLELDMCVEQRDCEAREARTACDTRTACAWIPLVAETLGASVRYMRVEQDAAIDVKDVVALLRIGMRHLYMTGPAVSRAGAGKLRETIRARGYTVVVGIGSCTMIRAQCAA